MNLSGVLPLLSGPQAGVVHRRQLMASGARSSDIARLLRRRELATLHAAVYVVHTGPPSWLQRAWAAVLLRHPAALSGASALRLYGVRTGAAVDRDPIDLLVDHARRVVDPPGVSTRRARDFEVVSRLHLAPPRVGLEHALLTVASGRHREDDAVAVLADACQDRRTTPGRLLAALETRLRLPGRQLLREVLGDTASGALSVLEQRYLRDVERAHGLPTGDRQVRRAGAGHAIEHDVEYPAWRLVVELDGRLRHEASTDRWRDLDRDLCDAGAGRLTLRLGWSQVLDPCATAVALAQVLVTRGWAGAPRRCPLCPPEAVG